VVAPIRDSLWANGTTSQAVDKSELTDSSSVWALARLAGCARMQQTVFGVGDGKGRLDFRAVEGPGADEDARRAVVCPAGKLLDAC